MIQKRVLGNYQHQVGGIERLTLAVTLDDRAGIVIGQLVQEVGGGHSYLDGCGGGHGAAPIGTFPRSCRHLVTERDGEGPAWRRNVLWITLERRRHHFSASRENSLADFYKGRGHQAGGAE